MRPTLLLAAGLLALAGPGLPPVPQVAHAQSVGASPHAALEERVSRILDRMVAELSAEQRVGLTPDAAAAFLTPEERRDLSAGFVRFSIDREAIVYVAFDHDYGETPFWLPDLGFERRADLDFIVAGEDPYHVWAGRFAPGEVRLGIPSFSGELKPYLVFAGPANGQGEVRITPLVEGTDVQRAAIGGEPFLDDNDVFTTLPDALLGLPVLRSYESWEFVSRIVGFFRATPYPSSSRPDHLQISWHGDPRRAATIQWRTDASVDSGLLWIAPKQDFFARGDAAARRIAATHGELRTRQIVNDPAVRLHRVALDDLRPGTDYLYAVSSDGGARWTAPREFRTAAERGAEPYSFVYLGDPQTGLASWGRLIREADFRHPDARFYLIAGDLVDHGTEQDHWDQLLHEGSAVFDRAAILPVIGNHDSHGGHPTLYLRHFALPDNGTDRLDPGRTYHVTYQDLLVVVLDSNYSLTDPTLQAEWLDRVLGESDARWKVVAFHHPFYASRPGRDNLPLREAWGAIFDRHGVDIVFQGHDHAYMRTQPMRAHAPVPEGGRGTTYLVAVSGDKLYEQAAPPFAAAAAVNTRTFQIIEVDPQAGTLHYRAVDTEGRTIDSFELVKD